MCELRVPRVKKLRNSENTNMLNVDSYIRPVYCKLCVTYVDKLGDMCY